jgi:hypothetical protein
VHLESQKFQQIPHVVVTEAIMAAWLRSPMLAFAQEE